MKKVTVMLAGGLPMAFLASPEDVAFFREKVRNKGMYAFEDTAIACDHVMAYYVEDAPKDGEETKEVEEDGCNT